MAQHLGLGEDWSLRVPAGSCYLGLITVPVI